MALRLGELVVCGELRNTQKNSTCGWLGLKGFKRPLTFELTGDCAHDLFGRHIRFEVRDPPKEDDTADDTEESEAAKLEAIKLTGLKWQQIGPTGTMTAARRVRAADCSTEELLFRLKHDEPPPMKWKRCLYLEWFGQNGRVVVEMVDPRIEFVAADDHDSSDQDEVHDDESPIGDDSSFEGHGLSITAFHLNENSDVDISDVTPPQCEDDVSCDECGDPYKLIPDELQKHLDAQTREADQALSGGDESDETIRELELLDDLIDRGEGEPLGMLFDGPVKLPSPDSLDDVQVETELKGLLARLALCGIALHMCEHYTPREAYRLLVEHLCMEETGYPELRPTQWVQHFLTSEFCEACEAELAREFEEKKRHKQGDQPLDDTGQKRDGEDA